MKKALLFILALVLCLNLWACGASQSDANTIAEYEKRIAELEALLAERDAEISRLSTENEHMETENITPENPDLQYTAVELTTENWDTYFEVVSIPEFTKNAFGEFDKFNLIYEFRLKEEYYPLLNAEKTTIAMEISYNYGERLCSVDFNNQTYTLGERTRTCPSTKTTDAFYDTGKTFYCSPFGIMSYDSGEVRYYEDVEMLRIQGTLFLKME